MAAAKSKFETICTRISRGRPGAFP